jgi:hypothetical protein
MNAHKIQKGICIRCGCDANAIEYFGWSCGGRSIQHSYVNGTCANCGFSKAVIEHFDWPCRLDFRKTHREEKSYHSSEPHTWERFTGGQSEERKFQAWHYPNDELRYGHLLGLKGKVTKWDIKCAYRTQANLYHPDRVAHLAPDIQAMANEKMKDINLAFKYFQDKYDL